MTKQDKSKLEIGDVVRLNSGGPDMTVFAPARSPLTPEGTVGCVWFVDNDELRTGKFHVNCVDEIAPEPQ